jgi:type IV secretory pathway VirB3-like protein
MLVINSAFGVGMSWTDIEGFMSIYVYVYVYLCVHMCIYVLIYVYIHICIHTRNVC